MTLPVNSPVTDRVMPGGQLVDISTASISYAPVALKGVIIAALCSISAAITGSDSVITVKVIRGGVTTTIGTITAAVDGSAAGSVFQMVLTGTEGERSVNVGDTLVFDNGGQSDTTSIANFVAVVRGA